ncbi:MAG: hypothetical protein U0457_14520 [Candidatus Sericytochromatia bacterium]
MKKTLKGNRNILSLLSIAFILSCNSNTTNNTTQPTKDNSSDIVLKNTISTNKETIKEEEKNIIDVINSNNELFSQNTDTDVEINDATVLNNGGVVFATVLNNGGVVFVTGDTSSTFSTKAVLPPLANSIKENIINNKEEKEDNKDSKEDKPKNTILDNIKNRVENRIEQKIENKVNQIKNKKVVPLPEKLIRKVVGTPKRDVKVNFNKDNTVAEVIVTITITREVFKAGENTPIKQVSESNVTKSIFIKEGKTWKIQKVGPAKNTSSDAENIKLLDDNILEIQEVKLVIYTKDSNNNFSNKEINVNLHDLQDTKNFLNIDKESLVTMQVKAINKKDPEAALNVFATFGGKDKINLYDDGSQDNLQNNPNYKSGDNTKNDDIYTANMLVKNKPSLYYLKITAIDGNSFNKDSNYLSVTKSIPINIK